MNNNRGVALIMVLSSIAILTAIILSFSYEAQINQIRSHNLVDRTQAKLTAESGLKIAMTSLTVYRDIFNKVQQNSTFKQNAPASLLNQIWSLPFIYPIPFSDDLSVGQKNIIRDFQEDSLLQGEFQVSVQNLGNKLNLNLLRLSYLNDNDRDDNDRDDDRDDQDQDELSFKDQFVELLRRAIDQKKEDDRIFNEKYQRIEPEFLIALIEIYVSDDSELCETDFCRQAETAYQQEGILPKGAPLANMDELFLLPVWNQELIELIRSEVSVHPILMIDLDSLTSKLLALILPDLTQENIDEYFKWKNDSEEPQVIERPDDMKVFFVDLANILSDEEFTRRFNDLEKIGIQFGPDASLFRILSQATYLEGSYEIEAIVSMPLLPTPPPRNAQQQVNPQTGEPLPGQTPPANQEEPEYPVQLLEPRIVDLFIR